MRRIRAGLAPLLAAAVLPGCFGTEYVNVQPRDRIVHHLPDDGPALRQDAWLEYSAFGTAPERRFSAARVCGGSAHIERIETGRSAFQAFVAAIPFVAAAYSAYTAGVVCDHGPAFARQPARSDLGIPTEFALSQTYPHPFDDVWQASIAALSAAGTPPALADRRRGVLIIPKLEFAASHAEPYRLGHTLGQPHRLLRREARLVLLVQPALPGAAVSIDAAMRIRIRTGNRDQHVSPRYEWRGVRSNLTLEREILDRVGAELVRIEAERRAR